MNADAVLAWFRVPALHGRAAHVVAVVVEPVGVPVESTDRRVDQTIRQASLVCTSSVLTHRCLTLPGRPTWRGRSGPQARGCVTLVSGMT
jgi:hypothetical protein